jgi:hypothetical protein
MPPRVLNMVDLDDEKNETPDTAQKTVREVVVTPLDEPPPSGHQEIHRRRPAPIIPTREERIRKQSDQDKLRKKPKQE